jgi:hypothetical protein
MNECATAETLLDRYDGPLPSLLGPLVGLRTASRAALAARRLRGAWRAVSGLQHRGAAAAAAGVRLALLDGNKVKADPGIAVNCQAAERVFYQW